MEAVPHLQANALQTITVYGDRERERVSETHSGVVSILLLSASAQPKPAASP
jgi:hypothetical protein